ncbi:aminopeptidase N [Calidifontibacter sp. DB0510]|uniref:Aminopeptidase N n=1 Tax=Metallococcus carri TaxID=1656884 RepID=A0A967EEF1_9MICO|nr:aminopeptidase N [Metallococcus carri]NHN55606.1 aminopeptidase N [Metallococcus carri]NOP38210.1 aminopeptidase N [Calidifontibacter sp. DB2511S]
MSTLNLTRAECAARGADIADVSYRIVLDLGNAEQLRVPTFVSRTTVRFTSASGQTWLDLAAEELLGLTINGVPADVSEYDGARIPLSDLRIGGAENVVSVSAKCRYSRSGDGLHRFFDPDTDEVYLYTHNEPTEARRIFACFEQPDLKASFDLVVTAPKDWVVRANAPETGRTEGEHSMTVSFAGTQRFSTYLMALAAGPYHLVEDEWRSGDQVVPLALLCRRSQVPYLAVEEIWETTRAGLDFYDEHFGTPYPWGKYDQIFLPEYNIGAMENPGLVTFNEAYLVRGEATLRQRTARASVILHEMAHMWFGDLVTMKWWDDLWLKESFADLMGYQVTQEVTPFDSSMLQFALSRKAFAYHYDRSPSTHPVVADIADLEAARQNFDGITYAKGASVLRALQELIGRDAFFAAARSYFSAHAFGTATFADLLAALQQVTDVDLASWAQDWLHTSSPSVLTPLPSVVEQGASERAPRRNPSLTLTQQCTDRITGRSILRPHRLDLGLYAVRDGALTATATVPVTFSDDAVEVPIESAVDLVVVNDGDLDYGLVRLDDRSRETFVAHGSSLPNPLTRAVVWSSLWNECVDAEQSFVTFVDAFCAQAPLEQHPMILESLGSFIAEGLGSYLPAAERDRQAARAAGAARAAYEQADEGSEQQRAWATACALIGEHTDALRDVLATIATGTAPALGGNLDLRWRAAQSLVARDAWTDEQIEELLRADDSMRGRTEALSARSGRPTPASREAVWARMFGEEQLSNDTQRALLAGFARSGARIADFGEAYLAMLREVWTRYPQSMAERYVRAMPAPDLAEGDVDSHPFLRQVGQLAEDPSLPEALRREIALQLDDAQRALRAQAKAARSGGEN